MSSKPGELLATNRTTQNTIAVPSQDTKRSKKIIQRVVADIMSAGIATLLVSPVICLVDRSIIENASGRSSTVIESVRASLKTMVMKPHHFLLSKPFALIYMTYFGTYITANLIDTSSSIRKGTNIKTVTTGTEKFVATSSANMSLGLIKDRNFARMFGTGSPRPVAPISFVLFAARDAMTIGSSFNIPIHLAPYIPNSPLMEQKSIAQFLAPAACQILSTPLHLLGLNIYNQGEKVEMTRRWQTIKLDYFPSVIARICRIVPAFGFGGVTNSKIRYTLMSQIEDKA